MALCDNIIQTIESTECLTDSLAKINSNFTNLESTHCSLRQRLQKNVQVRTFFYYGPNSTIEANSGMADEQTAKPSPEVITAFVNSPSQLNLPVISNLNDIAYVIYQKTGFQVISPTTATNSGISTNYTWGNVPAGTEINYSFAPALIIWRLVYDGTFYTISTGFPKYHREMTNNNQALWDKPQLWSQF
jgi:hypothetical protein